jgi:hypothetical protein
VSGKFGTGMLFLLWSGDRSEIVGYVYNTRDIFFFLKHLARSDESPRKPVNPGNFSDFL